MNGEELRPEADPLFRGDVEALRERTQRRLPPYAQVRAELERALAPARPTQPRWLLAAAAVGACLASGAIPFSYEKTVAHQVTATVQLPEGGSLRAAVRRIEAVLSAKETSAEPLSDSKWRIRTKTPLGRDDLAPALGALSSGDDPSAGRWLSGIEMTPVHERVWMNGYALAVERLQALDLRLKGRTHAEAEAHVRQQLEALGHQVSRIDFSDPQLGIVELAPGERSPPTRFSVDGRADDALTLRLSGASDVEKARQLERLLGELGVDAEVRIEGGQLRIERAPAP